MRKLDDGTYMYDTDSPWDRVLVSLGFCLFWILLFGVNLRFAIREYIDEGSSAFIYLTSSGTLYVGQIFAAVVWFVLTLRVLFQRIRDAKRVEI